MEMEGQVENTGREGQEMEIEDMRDLLVLLSVPNLSDMIRSPARQLEIFLEPEKLKRNPSQPS